VPDCARLFARLARDPGVPRSTRALLFAAGGYLALPFDLIPDFIPVIGLLDDALIVALLLRRIVRVAGAETVRRHWPGPERTLGVVLQIAGA
jgi:uncharacterized membrane protein YkvA (DUF1232 family)